VAEKAAKWNAKGATERTHQENIHLLFHLGKKKQEGFFLCFTPPENEFGNQLF